MNEASTEQPDEDHGLEPTLEKRIEQRIGPQKAGGRYYCGYWHPEYTVLKIERRPAGYWSPWRITVRWDDGRTASHCTPWDERRDRVVAEPPGA